MADHDKPDYDPRERGNTQLSKEDEKLIYDKFGGIPPPAGEEFKTTLPHIDFNELYKSRQSDKSEYCPKCKKYLDYKIIDGINENYPSKKVCIICNTFIGFMRPEPKKAPGSSPIIGSKNLF